MKLNEYKNEFFELYIRTYIALIEAAWDEIIRSEGRLPVIAKLFIQILKDPNHKLNNLMQKE